MLHPNVHSNPVPSSTQSRKGARGLALLSDESQGRERVEAFIKDKYYNVHQAELEEFLPLILGVLKENLPVCAVGLRPGQHRPMFLEQYLDAPIEQLVAGVCHRPVERCSLIEIGNLAIAGSGYGPVLMTLIAAALQRAGFEWMVFTVTTHVERLIRRLGFNPVYLAHASKDKLKKDASSWGRYYENNPKVMVGDLKTAQAIIEKSTFFSSIVSEFEQEIDLVASVLRDHRHTQRSTI